MDNFVLFPTLLWLPFEGVTFEAPGRSDAFWFGRGYIAARCELRRDFEIGSRWRIDRLVIEGETQVTDETTFVAECEIVERDGRIGATWRMLAPVSGMKGY